MALFTEFFPQPAAPGSVSHTGYTVTGALTNSQVLTLTLTGNTNQIPSNILAGNSVSVNVPSQVLAGSITTVTQTVIGTTEGTIVIMLNENATVADGAAASIVITETVFDDLVNADGGVLGDVTGDLTGDVLGDTINIGDTNTDVLNIGADETTPTDANSTNVSIHGTEIHFPDLESGNANDLVGRVNSDGEIVTLGLGTGLQVNQVVGSSPATYELSLHAMTTNNTYTYTTVTNPTSATDFRNIVTELVTAFNAATATAAGGSVTNGIRVAAAQTYDPGDIIILIAGAGANRRTETYIYAHTAPITAPADVTSSYFVDITTEVGITGSGTTGRIPLFDSANSITNSIITQDSPTTVHTGQEGNSATVNDVTVVNGAEAPIANDFDFTAANFFTEASQVNTHIAQVQINLGTADAVTAFINAVGGAGTAVSGFRAFTAGAITFTLTEADGDFVRFTATGFRPVSATFVVLSNGGAASAPASAITFVAGSGSYTGSGAVTLTAGTSSIEVGGGVTLSGIPDLGSSNTLVGIDASGVLSAVQPPTGGNTVQNSGNALTVNTTLVANSLYVLGRGAETSPAGGVKILTLPAGTIGDSIKLSNLRETLTGAWTGQWALVTNGTEHIMGQDATTADPFDLDDPTASFELVYTNTAIGWVIIGAN